MRKKYRNQKQKAALLFGCLFLSLTGCSSASSAAKDGQKQPEGQTEIGTVMTANAPQEFILLDNKDVLAADGLFYAAWGAGNPVPYENRQAWLASAEGKYKIQTTDTITCNSQSYTLITYDCIGEDTPYDHGVSALGVCGANAVCAELTCTKDYDGNLTALLKDFLNNCQYIQQN